jgi:hypothetical protein
LQGGAELAVNDLPLPAQTANGVVEFKDLVLPVFPIGATDVPLGFAIELSGTVNGTSASSDATQPNVVLFGKNAFRPLFLAGDLIGSGQRYGVRDAGGDSWATKRTIDWLTNLGFGTPALARFDDVSALHVARLANGRSVLGHAGHSNGFEADMRYTDGNGGFSDALGGQGGGASIKAMIDAARLEQDANTPNPANLTALRNWIAGNRSLFSVMTSDSRVELIYIGNGWFSKALVSGQYQDGVAISGVAAWPKPAKVQILNPDHWSHWHVNLVRQ